MRFFPSNIPGAVSRAFVLMSLFSLSSISIFASEHRIDPTASTLTVKVWKTGFLSGFAHNHDISAPITKGSVQDGSSPRVEFRVNTKGMQVLDPEASVSTREQIQHNMLSEEVLNVEKYPEIAFASTSVKASGTGEYLVTGNLTLHGQTHPVEVQVRMTGPGKYSGAAKLRQTTFGITPVSIGGGSIKIKDEVDIEFSIVTK